MKNLLVLFGILLCVVGTGNAQEKGFTMGCWSQVSLMTPSFNGHEKFGTIDYLAIAPGYAFNRHLFVRAQWEGTLGLWNRGGGSRTYRWNSALGPSIGCNVVNSPKSGIMELSAAAGNSLWNRDWSYLYYDFGI